MREKKDTRQIVLLGLLATMALLLFIVDFRLAVVPAFPGFKLGLANAVTLLAMEFFEHKAVFMLVAIRTVLGSLYSGSFLGPALAMSVGAGMVSTAGMLLARRLFHPGLSVIGISVCGAVLHNFTQLVIAAWLLGSNALYWYLPVLTVIGVLSGTVIGCIAHYAGGKLTERVGIKI